jgi:hypothetical protein
MCLVKFGELCGDVYMMMFVIFCDTCTLGDLIDNSYFDDSNEV